MGGVDAICDLSFAVEKGEFVAIVGPTGCGKTSVLNLVSGLLRPASGTVSCNGRSVVAVNPDVAYMFQQDALLPWKTVLENVMLGPRFHGADRDAARRQAREWIDKVGLQGFEDRYPFQLSGGQRKRVSMAQALILRPPILLMDEPFSALDAQTRLLMEEELLSLSRELQATVLFVTHDLEEALSLADRVLLFTAGPAARLKREFVVGLPRLRKVSEARFLPGFSELYERLWSDLKEEVMTNRARTRA